MENGLSGEAQAMAAERKTKGEVVYETDMSACTKRFVLLISLICNFQDGARREDLRPMKSAQPIGPLLDPLHTHNITGPP